MAKPITQEPGGSRNSGSQSLNPERTDEAAARAAQKALAREVVALAEPAHTSDSHTTFFRQGTWLILATGLSGVFMLATQMVAQRAMDEWGAFFALLRVYLLLGVPSLGLQTLFARQAAAAVTASQQAELVAVVRAVLRVTFCFWVGVVAVGLVGQDYWLQLLGIRNPAALWVTLVLGLAALWLPIFKGVVQGQQHFPGLGWSLILDGFGRFMAVTVIVVWWGGQAAGGMTGALVGQVSSLAVVLWVLRSLFRRPSAKFAWRPWLRGAAPLALGSGLIGLLSTVDVVYVRAIFPEAVSNLYNRGAMIGLALMTVSLPLVQVMFPKVARSTALTRPSQAMYLALAATAGVGALAALLCTAFPALPLRLIFIGTPAALEAAPLVPWFAWVLLPLMLAMVLINNLLAQERFQIVPWMLGVIALYFGALAFWKTRLPYWETFAAFRALLSTLGLANLALLLLAVRFTARERVAVEVEAP